MDCTSPNPWASPIGGAALPLTVAPMPEGMSLLLRVSTGQMAGSTHLREGQRLERLPIVPDGACSKLCRGCRSSEVCQLTPYFLPFQLSLVTDLLLSLSIRAPCLPFHQVPVPTPKRPLTQVMPRTRAQRKRAPRILAPTSLSCATGRSWNRLRRVPAVPSPDSFQR